MSDPSPPLWSPWELAYCSNVHPAPDLAGLRRVVQRDLAAVRGLRRRGPMGCGLWIGAGAARQLNESPGLLEGLAEALGLEGADSSWTKPFTDPPTPRETPSSAVRAGR